MSARVASVLADLLHDVPQSTDRRSRPVLMALSASSTSDRVLQAMHAFAQRLGVELHVIRVVPHVGGAPGAPPDVAHALHEAHRVIAATRHTRKLCDRALHERLPMKNSCVRLGAFVDQVAQRAAEVDAQIIIVPRGASRLTPFVTDLARRTDCAVLVPTSRACLTALPADMASMHCCVSPTATAQDDPESNADISRRRAWRPRAPGGSWFRVSKIRVEAARTRTTMSALDRAVDRRESLQRRAPLCSRTCARTTSLRSMTRRRAPTLRLGYSGAEMKPLREAQRSHTRERILDGAERVLRGGHALSFPVVAQAAEVPLRTVYRYFESRQALDGAIWQRILQRFGRDVLPSSIEDYLVQTREAFARFSADPMLVRAMLHSPDFIRLRQVDEASRRAALERCLCPAAPDLSPRDRRRAAAVLRVLNSARAWELLTDLWGLDPKEAATSVEFAIQALLAGLTPSAERAPPARGKRRHKKFAPN